MTSLTPESTDTVLPESTPAIPAGVLLRQYREAAGLSPEDLAKQLRVSYAKLLALEQENWEELKDVVFVRSLALTICRFLKVDATAVLQALPKQEATGLKKLDSQGLNAMVQRPRLTPYLPGQSKALGALLSAQTLKLLAMIAVAVGLVAAVFWGVSQWWNAPVEKVSAPTTAAEPEASVVQGNMILTPVTPGVPLPAPVTTDPVASDTSATASESVNGR